MLGVVLVVLLLLAVSLGATGFSDRMLEAAVGEELRAQRSVLAETIRDPDRIEEVLTAQRAELRATYGLDQPWQLRLPATMARVLTLDLGEAHTMRSFSGSNRVADIVLERLPNTMALLTTALVITAAIGISVGVRMATRAGSATDRAVSYLAAVSYAMPAWWVGILMILLFSFGLGWLPSGGMLSAPAPDGTLARAADVAWHAVLPVVTLVVAGAGPYIYVVRTMTLDAAQQDHVALARAKGMPEGIVVRRHVLRVAAPPILTGLILGFAGSLGGSILVETVFTWPGMGRLYYEAIVGTPDEMVIVALTFLYTLIYVIARMVLEVLYVLVDPRVRYERV
jgi:peptide/nickel transport system permease protein